jgi:hypothetical protein
MLTASPTFLTANAIARKEPVFLLTIAGYSRVFSNKPGYGDNDWIVGIADLSTTVSDLDGGADLGTLTVTVSDGIAGIVGDITSDFPSFVFEGKKVTLETGFAGQSTADFLTIFTGVIDTVASSNSNTCYDFNCTDDLMWTTQVIYGTGDSGRATDSNNPKTLNAHPLDILIDVIKNQLGRSTLEYNEANILGYRDSVFAGLQFTFEITSPPAGRDFIEQQIMQPLGGYLFTNAAGQLDVHFSGPKIGAAVQVGALIGSFVDSSGQIIGAPFLVGYGCTLVVPAGADHFPMGLAKSYFADNAGFWNVRVDDDTAATTLANPATISGTAAPWLFTGGINSSFPITDMTGHSAPTSIAVTAGHQITTTYLSGTASVLGFTYLAGPLGPGGFAVIPGNPAYYAYSPQPVVGTFAIDSTNMIGPPINDIPVAGQADLVNQVSFRFDQVGGSYTAEAVKNYAPSIALYTQYGQHIIQSDGMRSGLQGYILAAQTAALIFQRYGKKNLKFDNSVVVDWTGCVLEVGDVVAVTNPFIPDRVAGVRGIAAKLFEVLDRTFNFNDGRVTLTLQDTGLNLYRTVYIAPSGEASYASASTLDKSHYMFLCDNTDKYSTGAAANLLT